MNVLSWNRAAVGIKNFLRDYTVECLMSLIIFVGICSSFNNFFIKTFWAYFYLFFAISYLCNRLCRGRWRYLYYTIPALFIAYCVGVHFIFDMKNPWISAILPVFLVIITDCRRRNECFTHDLQSLFTTLLLSSVIVGIIIGVIGLISLLIQYLFDVNTGGFMLYSGAIVVFSIAPLLVCYLQSTVRRKRSEQESSRHKIYEIIYIILSIAAIVYALILYLYFVSIVLQGEWPKGKIAIMVIGLFTLSLFGSIVRYASRYRIFDIYYKYFAYIGIVPLAVLWGSIAVRVSEYGLTDSRIYLILIGTILTLFDALLLLKRANYHLLFTFCAISLVATTYIPGISAYDLSVYNQELRLIAFAQELGIWDETNRKLIPVTISKSDSEKYRIAVKLKDSYYYSERHSIYSDFVERWGEQPVTFTK